MTARKDDDEIPDLAPIDTAVNVPLLNYRLAQFAKQIEGLSKELKETTAACRDLEKQMAVMKVASGVIGTISGALSFFVTWGVQALRSGKTGP